MILAHKYVYLFFSYNIFNFVLICFYFFTEAVKLATDSVQPNSVLVNSMGGHRELVKDKTVLVPDSDPESEGDTNSVIYSDCESPSKFLSRPK